MWDNPTTALAKTVSLQTLDPNCTAETNSNFKPSMNNINSILYNILNCIKAEKKSH